MASSSKSTTKIFSSVGGKVRVIGRIRGFSHHELASVASHPCIISVRKFGDSGLSEKVKISFDDQASSRKNEYEMDYCYGQNEDTGLIFSKEIVPQISKLFDGESSTFIAFGARDSGKTYTIHGSEDNLGLGMMAMDEILKIVEEGRHEVVVSIYEVFQNHVYDLLDSKNSEVHVLEDAQGKIKLKGLSKVQVKSMSEFQKLYYSENISNKPNQKIKLEFPRRSHKALMIHILACDEGGHSKCVGKINFLDLAGYENARRNSTDGTNLIESTNINKSLNALLNVIHAINANEIRIPYRESIIARVIQDSLGGRNHISMLVCLNPLFCPDTIHAAALASRLKNIKPVAVSSVKKQTTSRVPLSANKASSGAAICSTTKKQTNSRFPLSAKKTNVVIKARKLFGATEQESGMKEKVSSKANNSSDKVTSDIPDGDSTVVPYVKEEKCSSDGALVCSDPTEVASTGVPCPPIEEIAKSDVTQDMESVETLKEDVEVKTQSNCPELVPYVNGNVEKENNSLLGQSPPSVGLQKILSRLQNLEFKNREQALDSLTPLSIISTPHVDANTETVNFVDTMEPKTPIHTKKMDFSNCPSGTFSMRSSGMKHSLVKEYLQFLNSASKEDLKGIPGIGEKRAGYILELREDSPEPFKNLDDLQEIGMSAKQVQNMMKNVAGKFFS